MQGKPYFFLFFSYASNVVGFFKNFGDAKDSILDFAESLYQIKKFYASRKQSLASIFL